MAEKRQLELYLLRFLLHPLRDDFVTVGLLLQESGGGFADVRFTSDWRLIQCIAPDLELEWFQMVENEIRSKVGSLWQRENLMQMISDQFGTMIEVSPSKAVLTEDPEKEMEVLASTYLVPVGCGEREQGRTGRLKIVSTMKKSFADAGVLEMLQRDLDVAKYTGQADPFKVDFGYRVGNTVNMFHAVSVMEGVDEALALIYRYSLVATGLRKKQLKASLTAVVDEESALREERQRFAIGMLQQHSVRVASVELIAVIAGEVRRELRA